jgi:signal peptidase II
MAGGQSGMKTALTTLSSSKPLSWLKLGLITALIVLLLDQASKLGLIYGTHLRLTYPWTILPVMDLTVVWNRGISYGLFQQNSEMGRWILTAFKLGAAVFLTFWLKSAANRWEALGLGLIIGGAVGNAIDRILHGAVFDFIHVYVGEFSWYVFNIADAAIVVGVCLMLIAQFGTKSPPETSEPSANEKP